MMEALNIQYDLGLIYLEYGMMMKKKGDVEKDEEGLKAARELGRNIAILCKFKAETRHIEGLV